jgi:hypothetical protein
VGVDILSYAIQIPHRVIEDDEHFWFSVQSGEDLPQLRAGWMNGVRSKNLHPFASPGAGQVVDPEVKGLGPVGNCPFNGNRAVLFAQNWLEQQGCLNAVVVGQRDHGRKIELLNLPALQVKSELWPRRGSPVAQPVIDSPSMIGLAALFKAMHESAHESETAAETRQKFQRLAGLIGVTVE